MDTNDQGAEPAASTQILLTYGRHAPDDPPPLGPAPQLETIATETRHYRHDGWTPAARAGFLEMLAKSGVVTDACREVQVSSQAAYALRNRDLLFAAGWDAALSLARARLADELFHRSVNGMVDQVWKDGDIVAERHHHDNRLSIAVLNRLDARTDRAERIGAPSLNLAGHWEAYLAALSEDRIADAEALLAPPPVPAPAPVPVAVPVTVPALLGHGSDAMLIHQFHQLRSGMALDEAGDCDARDDDDTKDERVWVQDHSWRTNYPPPDDFHGDEYGDYGEEDYDRQCTPDERALLDRAYPTLCADGRIDPRAVEEDERDAFFAALKDEIDELEAGRADDDDDAPDDTADDAAGADDDEDADAVPADNGGISGDHPVAAALSASVETSSDPESGASKPRRARAAGKGSGRADPSLPAAAAMPLITDSAPNTS